ncbi:hypothetical protein B0H13DRAFT_1928106 [Mycena leptocephala]|nr:hypothetical protein B0H13DRAFT_1928106 [Mycena leptocephala]
MSPSHDIAQREWMFGRDVLAFSRYIASETSRGGRIEKIVSAVKMDNAMTHQCTTRCAVRAIGRLLLRELSRVRVKGAKLRDESASRGVGRVYFEVRHLVEILNSSRRFFHGAMYSWIRVRQLEDLEEA